MRTHKFPAVAATVAAVGFKLLMAVAVSVAIGLALGTLTTAIVGIGLRAGGS